MSNETGAITNSLRIWDLPRAQQPEKSHRPVVADRARMPGPLAVRVEKSVPARDMFASPRNTDARPALAFRQDVRSRWGDDVAVLPKKPPRDFTQHAIWPSSTGAGYGVHLPGKGSVRVADWPRAEGVLAAAGVVLRPAHVALQQLAAAVHACWGDAVGCADAAPESMPARPVIWNSRTPGLLRLMLPDGTKYRVRGLDRAAELLSSHGILTLAQARAHQFASDVQARWATAVDVRSDAPPEAYARPAIWRSISSPGHFSLYVPGQGYHRAGSLDEAAAIFRSLGVLTSTEQEGIAAHRRFKAEAYELWGDQVSARKRRPHAQAGKPVVWPSATEPGTFGLRYPDGKIVRVGSLKAAADELAACGIATRMGCGAHIQVAGPDLSDIERLALEKKHGIRILPIDIDGKRIAYRFSAGQAPCASVLLSCHGTAKGRRMVFTKPSGLTLSFVAPGNTILKSHTLKFAGLLRDGKAEFNDASQVYGTTHENVTNYRLAAEPWTSAADMAAWVATMDSHPDGKKFDTILLNSQARGVRLGDLLEGLGSSAAGLPPEVICHFCRTRDASATVVYPPNWA